MAQALVDVGEQIESMQAEIFLHRKRVRRKWCKFGSRPKKAPPVLLAGQVWKITEETQIKYLLGLRNAIYFGIKLNIIHLRKIH